MKKKYVKPVIHKLQEGVINKFGAAPFYTHSVRADIEGHKISDLTEKYGSPLFVISEKAVRDKIHLYKETYNNFYPQFKYSWSLKTNYLDAVNAIFFKENFFAEVVSEMEYEKTRRIGIPGNKILFNGPNKSRKILETAIDESAKIHVDHFDEINLLDEITREKQQPANVAIRLNLDSGIRPVWTRFGFNLESGQAEDAVEIINSTKYLKLKGLHCHIGTFILKPEAYKTQITKMINFMYKIHDKFEIELDYIDIGGGLPSSNKLKGTYLSPEFVVPDLDNYAEKISEALYDNLQPNHKIDVYLENGRALIDEAGYLITSVKATKQLPDGTKNYVLDAGVNLLYTSTWYKYKIEMEKNNGVGLEMSLLNGPLCMNIDVVADGIMLPPLEKNDKLILSPVGAYNVTQWMQFIEYRPAIILIATDGSTHVIRDKEDLSDLVRREHLPEHLTFK